MTLTGNRLEARMRDSFRFGGVALLALLAACGGGDDDVDAGMVSDTVMNDTAAPAGTAVVPMPDGEIVAVLSAADSSEILPSQLAAERAENAQVKEYARMMVRDHGILEDSMAALAQQNAITPAPNAMSQQMAAQTQSTVQSLQGLSGAAFDSAYVAWMVQSHQTALDALDQRLLPAAQNPQLRAAIEQKVRPTVQTHLQQIQQLRTSIGGS